MILVFDAQCLLCNGSVKFLLKHDHQKFFQFASIQSESGKALLLQAGLRVDKLETILLVDGQQSWQHTAAIFRVLHKLGWPWRLAWIGWIIPAPLRDAAYRLGARNRYKLFGSLATCAVPPVDYKSRFLD